MKQSWIIIFVLTLSVFERAYSHDSFFDDYFLQEIQIKLNDAKCLETLESVKQDTGLVRTICYVDISESGKFFSLVKPKEKEKFLVNTMKLKNSVTVTLEKYQDKVKIVGEYPRSSELLKFLYSRETFKALVGDIVKNIPYITVQVE